MDKLISILKSLHDHVDWMNESGLVDDGIIDSFDIIALVGDLNDEFGVEIELEHLTPENFNSVSSIMSLLQSLGAQTE